MQSSFFLFFRSIEVDFGHISIAFDEKPPRFINPFFGIIYVDSS